MKKEIQVEILVGFFCNYCNVTYIGKFMKERWMLIGIRFLYNGSVDSMP